MARRRISWSATTRPPAAALTPSWPAIAHVYTIASFVKTSLDKTPNDLRDKRLLTFDQDKLTRVDLQPAKGETIEFGKNNQNDWQILKPKPLRADGSQVEELIRKLKDAKMDATVSAEDAKKAAAAFASGTKVAVATRDGFQRHPDTGSPQRQGQELLRQEHARWRHI